MSGRHIVVGGGISGLVAALLLSERHGAQVTLVEREREVGGLLRCFDYGEWGRFDYGMHNMFETGVAALDGLLFGLLPEADWQLLEAERRDLAGLYWRGRIQANSPYPDLRDLPEAELRACIAGCFRRLGAGPEDRRNAEAYARSRFGDDIAERVVCPAVEKQFQRPAAELDLMATTITTLGRVVMFDEAPFLDLMQSRLLRERLAFPEQRRLPAQFASGRRAYYPRRYGMYRIVDALLGRLRERGVEVLTGASVSGAEVRDGAIRAVDVAMAGGRRRFDQVSHLLWTTGLPAAGALLGLAPVSGGDRPQVTVVVNILLRQPCRLGDLYYIYCYEPGFSTFRVTNYPAYCDGAPRAGFFPICVELLVREAGDPAALAAQALDELRRFGLIDSPEDVVFARAEPLAAGFPMPTLRNLENIDRVRADIAALGLRNFTAAGILSAERLFFQTDVLAHVHRVLLDRGLA